MQVPDSCFNINLMPLLMFSKFIYCMSGKGDLVMVPTFQQRFISSCFSESKSCDLVQFGRRVVKFNHFFQCL